MAEDTQNGARILIEEIDRVLEQKTISSINRLLLRVSRYQLMATIQLRAEIAPLKRHDVVGWAIEHPRAAWLISIAILVANSMINWEGVRKPLMQAVILHTMGVLVPFESLP